MDRKGNISFVFTLCLPEEGNKMRSDTHSGSRWTKRSGLTRNTLRGRRGGGRRLLKCEKNIDTNQKLLQVDSYLLTRLASLTSSTLGSGKTLRKDTVLNRHNDEPSSWNSEERSCWSLRHPPGTREDQQDPALPSLLQVPDQRAQRTHVMSPDDGHART